MSHEVKQESNWSADRQNTAMWVVTVFFVFIIGMLMGKITV